ncbi:RelA/SpoT family protein [Patescibacteria group bacterium]|nr:RelA/SpoT family protein [Patescibacteria group bacterium]MBU1563505.1 RelA/SpoT family protein [Patescibacteria group bacterium]MBU2068063.1 RelA/SpoT family protein [Patescibacteria group bacterium]
MTIEQVINKFRQTHPLTDTQIIEKTYLFVKEAHHNQIRLNGEPRLEHLLQTAYTLAELKLDTASLVAGLLHDILEYTPIKLTQIEKQFGNEIAFLVEGITYIDKIRYHKRDKAAKDQVENIRKILLAMAKDIRVILIKLADRLHNMKTLDALPKEKQKRIALETLEIYAPLAYRLGIGELKGQLEDLAFPYVYPKEYQEIVDQVKDRYSQNKRYIEKITPSVKKTLTKKGIRVIEIHSRTKHYYSLYKKLLRYDMDWHRIYDLVALRIIVPDIENCYAALGIIHKNWRPLIGRIKDYIAIPKHNGYQSIHTTVFCQEGKITEFQIRTPQMHQKAEHGIAAHWHYTEKRGLKDYIRQAIFREKSEKKSHQLIEELTWVKQLQEWQKEQFSSPDEFINSLKIDFLKDRIFVFTPNGDVIDLPEGATPIDFAYEIHSDVGDQCTGAKIDGKMTTLSEQLKNGQVIEIITQKNKKPSRDWLKFVKTSQAKSRIKNYYKKN